MGDKENCPDIGGISQLYGAWTEDQIIMLTDTIWAPGNHSGYYMYHVNASGLFTYCGIEFLNSLMVSVWLILYVRINWSTKPKKQSQV